MKCVDVYKFVRYQISFNKTLKTSERSVPPFWIELCGQTFYVYPRLVFSFRDDKNEICKGGCGSYICKF